MKRVALLLAVFLPALSLRATDEAAPPTNGVVRQVDIAVKRVDPEVIRRELTLREGEPFTAGKLEESRQNLHELGLFKSLDVEAKWDPSLDGYRVTVKADDGWFVFPMPMFGSRGGESYAGLMLMERNYFRHSEGIMLFGALSEGRSSVMASVFLPQVFGMAGVQQSSLEEYQYADGGYNSKQFDKDLQHENPGDFGTVTNQYKKDVDKVSVMVGDRVLPWLRVSGGLSHSSVSYSNAEPSAPDDAGDINAWLLSLSLGRKGRSDPAAQGGMLGAFGRIFGLGMAGVKDSLTPLPESETTRTLQISPERGESWLGSDAAYTKLMLGVDQTTIFCRRSRLSLSLKGGWGDELPPSQLLSTGQRGLLSGVYAREVRGDRIAAGSAVFTQPFFRNMIGTLNAEVFADTAVCWADDNEWKKEGVGFNLAYRFWRFPLPLGGGVTYSLDDSNWQFSFAVGGSF